MENEKLGEMTVEEDTDGKAVWVFEGKIKTDVPLKTDADTVVEAINELAGKLQDEGGGDDWSPPDIPEPQDNQIILLVRVNSDRVGLPAVMFAPSNKNGRWTYGTGRETVDWGDGYTDTSVYNNSKCFVHCYSQVGEYTVTINLTPDLADYDSDFGSDCIGILTRAYANADSIIMSGDYKPEDFLDYIIPPTENLIHAVKIGKAVGMTTTFSYMGRLEYAKFCGVPKTYNSAGTVYFGGCRILKKVDFDILPDNDTFQNYSFGNTSITNTDFMVNVTKMHPGVFLDTLRLKTLNLPNLEELTAAGNILSNSPVEKIYLPKLEKANGVNIAQGCYALTEVYAPNVAEINSSDFYNCFNLNKLVLAENCNLNGNTFSTCYCLYPKPQ